MTIEEVLSLYRLGTYDLSRGLATFFVRGATEGEVLHNMYVLHIILGM